MRSTISGYTALPKAHKISATAVLVAAGAAVALAAVPATAADTHSVKTVAQSANEFGATQQAELAKATDAAITQATTTAKAKTTTKAGDERANRSTDRKALKPAKPAAPAKKAYADNLDGWIKESLDILSSKGIPASYDGIKRNVMRESTGNPNAINDWDVNAVNGVPSKGLLQIIDPTFKAYHVEGTSWNIYDPVANITASCAYAADKYGSMDNVNSAY
ncbi:transglycosylase SLT domain-containing protein [Streptomyces sp. UNOB3_S3]|uniref:transglycosylase SLT domain-containing protein n=1 Tax=Streptomyces sp. UNOB3_S3 TaxID=2871682 RepID=UPI001E51E2EA|nr:transglycosylase SLT domain-containing protein [Streptomyces sp. UNOB3_S3]MCC3776782.1 transglycosylase SLT domain-containing protein [Streptomyces sp. UNOB3_S3]